MVQFADSPTEAAFREEVRAFIKGSYEPLRESIRVEMASAQSKRDSTPT